MSVPPSYVRPYLSEQERRYDAPGEKPCARAEAKHGGLRALLAIAHQQERDTGQDRELAQRIRELLRRRPDLADTHQTNAPLTGDHSGEHPRSTRTRAPDHPEQGTPGEVMPCSAPSPARLLEVSRAGVDPMTGAPHTVLHPPERTHPHQGVHMHNGQNTTPAASEAFTLNAEVTQVEPANCFSSCDTSNGCSSTCPSACTSAA